VICPTGKVRFGTAGAAGQALVEAKIRAALRSSTRRRECRYYRCDLCDGYHLTSRPDRQQVA
jgi:hypothetical protein